MATAGAEYHVLTKGGDASGEVAAVVREIGSPESAGLYRCFFVTRANQTVVMAADSEAPVVVALRTRPGWQEPDAGTAM